MGRHVSTRESHRQRPSVSGTQRGPTLQDEHVNGVQLFQPVLEAVLQPDGLSQQRHLDLLGQRLCGGAAPHRGGSEGPPCTPTPWRLRGAAPHHGMLSSVPGFYLGFPGGSDGKESTCNVGGDQGLIPGSERSAGEGNGNPLLENPRDRGAWQATVHGVTNSQIRLRD